MKTSSFEPLDFGTADTAFVTRRFIPREQLRGVTHWQPVDFGPGQPAPGPSPLEIGAHVAAARRAGYEEGYARGREELEVYKEEDAVQLAAQMEIVAAAFAGHLDGLEQELAGRVVDVVLALARQVVRSELAQRPEHVVQVAREALDTLMASARQIVLRINPGDETLVARGLAERIAAQEIRIVADPALSLGDCLVESDLGSVDARVTNRWQRAMATIGRTDGWNPDPEIQPEPAQ